MKHLINNNVKNIEISGIRKFFNLVSDEKDVVSLTIGQPDFHTPDNVKNAGIQAIENNFTTYTPNQGIWELRKAIHTYYKTNYGLAYQPDSEIIVTSGASEAIDITFRTILTPGDEVILPSPIYPGYEPLITLAGAKPVHVDTTNTGFKFTPEALADVINENTKCIVLPSPSNPTGAAYSREELEALAGVIKGKEIFILSDEIYSEIVFDFAHTSIASISDLKNQTIVINGVSKSHSMTGFRIGYTLAPEWISEQMLKVHQYNVSCAASISQYAALEALTTYQEHTAYIKEVFKKRRDYVYERLTGMGLEVEQPQGAFYIFPKLTLNDMSSFDLGLSLVRDARVALVPGSSFSKDGEGYMRLSYAYHEDILKEGLDRLEAYLLNKK
ncbi:putative N-acetyl-LL-diaminopimelate aminotransferase [Oceanobacillus oncorhynchi subsp. incaldanensis]|uniref:aminotransferase A n=1 Tax=Oceanobacillus oncorhynchi TaxID=545501 RepID=UPI001B1CA989|nr:aminotransferase A [Oceanobacillus oncorhynchi]GIO18211.1 putative N-acetyl-LL-diaminopimelate aminotransferase [Oceanobacillus oncorhynchi subsp. incaldanensis]